MTDKDKLRQILDFYNLSTARFAAKIGLSEERILDSILQGSCKISRIVRKKISTYCKEINIYWLYTGKGKMLIKDYKEDMNNDLSDSEKICIILQHYNISATDFAEKIGIQKQTIYDIQHGKSRISKKVRPKIIAAYPELENLLVPKIESLPSIHNGRYGIQAIGRDNVINATPCDKEIGELQSQISLLKKDIELWQAKYQSANDIIENQKLLIKFLTEGKQNA